MPLILTKQKPTEIIKAAPGCSVLDIRAGENGQNGSAAVYGAYASSLETAAQKGCENAVLPLIVFEGLSKNDVFDAALSACKDHLKTYETNVILAVPGGIKGKIPPSLYGFKNEQKEEPSGLTGAAMFCAAATPAPRMRDSKKFAVCEDAAVPCYEASDDSLQEYIKNVDKGFSETLLQLIDKSGMTDVQCYKRANVDRKLFSKIRSTPDYRPKKTTALSFCIALSLSLEQTKELLSKAGYTLSKSSKGDLIVEYYITHGKYDIYEINEALFEYDQALLGV